MALRIVTALGLSLFALTLGGCVVDHHHRDRGWYHDHDHDRDRDHYRYHDRDWR